MSPLGTFSIKNHPYAQRRLEAGIIVGLADPQREVDVGSDTLPAALAEPKLDPVARPGPLPEAAPLALGSRPSLAWLLLSPGTGRFPPCSPAVRRRRRQRDRRASGEGSGAARPRGAFAKRGGHARRAQPPPARGLWQVSRGRCGWEGRRYDVPPFANAKRWRRGPRGDRKGVLGGAAGRERNEGPLFENALSKAASLAKVTRRPRDLPQTCNDVIINIHIQVHHDLGSVSPWRAHR